MPFVQCIVVVSIALLTLFKHYRTALPPQKRKSIYLSETEDFSPFKMDLDEAIYRTPRYIQSQHDVEIRHIALIVRRVETLNSNASQAR